MPVRIQRAITERQAPAPGQPALTTPQDLGAGVADAMSALGRRISEREAESRQVRVREAMVQAHAEAAQAVKRYRQRTGTNAMGLSRDAQKELAQIGQKYAEGFDRKSRELFRQQYDSQSVQYLTNLYGYETEQQQAAVTAQRQASFDLAMADATRDPYDMASIAMSYERMQAVRLEQAEAQGLPPEVVEAQLMKDRTVMWRSVVERQLSLGDDRSAAETLRFAMDEIDSRDVSDLQAKIEGAGKVRGWQQQRDTIIQNAYRQFLDQEGREPGPEELAESALAMARDRLEGQDEEQVRQAIRDQFHEEAQLNKGIVERQVQAGLGLLQGVTDPMEQDRIIATIDRPEAQQELRAVMRAQRNNFASEATRDNTLAYDEFLRSVDNGAWQQQIRDSFGDEPSPSQIRRAFDVRSQQFNWTEKQHREAWQYAQSGMAGRVKYGLFARVAKGYDIEPGDDEWRQAWDAFVEQASLLPRQELTEDDYEQIMRRITTEGYGVTADDMRSIQAFEGAGALGGESFLPAASYDTVVSAMKAEGLSVSDANIADYVSRLQARVDRHMQVFGEVISIEDIAREQLRLSSQAAQNGLTIPDVPPPARRSPTNDVFEQERQARDILLNTGMR